METVCYLIKALSVIKETPAILASRELLEIKKTRATQVRRALPEVGTRIL
jgi:DNA-binding HxlR family transcriptional regulator